jgi:hypothetical protein
MTTTILLEEVRLKKFVNIRYTCNIITPRNIKIWQRKPKQELRSIIY